MPDLQRRPLQLGLLLGGIISLIFAVGFVSGALLVRTQSGSDLAGSDRSLREFLSAYDLVTHQSYYQPLDRRHLIYAAIDGMLAATGDPHTIFLSPQQNQVANRDLNGTNFSGIGAIVVSEKHDLQVLAPIPRAPASRAGIRAGDVVTRINGQPVQSMPGTVAVDRIHGPPGTIVRLTIQRAHQRPFTVSVRRANIAPITAYGRMLTHGIGYIDVVSFGDTTLREVSDALAYLRDQHARSLVLDLRQNPGGYVDAAQGIVSRFLRRGVVAYERGSDRQLRPLPVISNAHPVSLPMVVLVDSGTASAAEITAGALHDYHRAYLIGTRTYGKGSMQSVYALADGSSIRITDRLWLTPNKHSIQSVGITPDLVVQPGPTADGSDPQLTAAERYLLTRTAR